MRNLETTDAGSRLAAEEGLSEQAAELESLLPSLMRSLFSLDPEHRVAEMPLAQLRLCAVLQGGPKSPSVVADMLGISASAVTQLADRLEHAGLLERAPCSAEDRRLRRLRLTACGASMMRERQETRRGLAAAALRRLPPETRATVLGSLRTLLAANSPNPIRMPSHRLETTGDGPLAADGLVIEEGDV